MTCQDLFTILIVYKTNTLNLSSFSKARTLAEFSLSHEVEAMIKWNLN